VGGQLKGRWSKKGGRSGGAVMSAHPAAKFFFLRPQTERLKTPARPIIKPFWAAHRDEALGGIHDLWMRKFRGERI
jgi:hypothetical protein